MAKEILQVNRIRLRERRSVPSIAREMGVERSTLQRVLKTPGRQPRETTLAAMRDWLKRRDRPAKRRRR